MQELTIKTQQTTKQNIDHGMMNASVTRTSRAGPEGVGSDRDRLGSSTAQGLKLVSSVINYLLSGKFHVKLYHSSAV